MSIIKHNGKFYKEVDPKDLTKDELLELIEGVEEVPKKEVIREYIDRPNKRILPPVVGDWYPQSPLNPEWPPTITCNSNQMVGVKVKDLSGNLGSW